MDERLSDNLLFDNRWGNKSEDKSKSVNLLVCKTKKK
jgi:hypothetical protein